MGRGKYARTKPEDLTVVPNYVPFPTTVAHRGFEARELFKPGLVPDDSGVSEGHRFGVSIGESQVVGIRSRSELESEWLQVPVGLFPPPPTQDIAGHEATLRWLDRQARGSVVYAAFGSEAKLTSAQLQTIALGLEASGFRPAVHLGVQAASRRRRQTRTRHRRVAGRLRGACQWQGIGLPRLGASTQAVGP
jgi:hypothetical protein